MFCDKRVCPVLGKAQWTNSEFLEGYDLTICLTLDIIAQGSLIENVLPFGDFH
jgi:hypothetical protein